MNECLLLLPNDFGEREKAREREGEVLQERGPRQKTNKRTTKTTNKKNEQS